MRRKLAEIEAATNAPEPQPEVAASLLGLEPDPETVSGPEPATPRKRGRPPGSRNRGKSPRGISKAEAIARAERAEAELARRVSSDSPEYQQEIAGLAVAIGGTVGAIVDMTAPAPARLTDEERQRLGELWAPVLHPYLGALGNAAPWVMAVVGTGQIALSKVQAIREAREAEMPPVQPGPEPIDE